MVSPPREVARVLDRALNEDSERLAIVARSGGLTYAELDRRADRWGRALREQGVDRGDRVAVCMPNDLDILCAFHGAMRLGAVWVGVNQALAPPEKAYMLRHSEARVLLCEADTAAQVQAQGEAVPEQLRTLVAAGEGSEQWQAAVAAQAAEPLGVTVDPYAPAGIAYTSGTTGFPKGVVQSQWNLLLPGTYLNATRRYGTDLRKGDCFPLTILNMMVLTTLLTSQAGGRAVIMDRVSAEVVAEWVSREMVTVWNGPPPLLYTLAQDARIAASDLKSLTEVWSGGADCPESIRHAFESKFGVEVRGTYGLTEAPTVVSIEVPDTEHLAGSSGVPLPHLEVTIRDPAGRRVDVGQPGEICIAARRPAEIEERLGEDWGIETAAEHLELPEYRPMLGYWNQPDASAVALGEGFLRTGDVGMLRRAGDLVVSDRISLVLNRGGANVYPAEIERVVMSFPQVDGCGVFGVADERLGERVAMLIQFEPASEPDLSAVLDHCRSELAAYKVPELVAAVSVLPRNAMGKIDRRELAKIGQPLVARVGR